MGYENATATNIADLFTKLSTFAVANGWTQDHAAADRLFLTKSTVSVAFRWDAATPTCAGVYQHTAFIAAGTAPGNHTNDSGQGQVSGTDATLLTGRRVTLVNSTMQYWFFEEDTYIHIVVETSVGTVYRHFGFGLLDKFGTWTGGEYSYAGRTTGATNPQASTAYTELLDGFAGNNGSNLTTIQPFVACLHIEGAPGEGGASKWGLLLGGAPTVNDRGGNARVQIVGSYRGGPTTTPFGRYSGTVLQGLVPLVPQAIFYRHPTLSRVYPLGVMKDVRQTNMKAFAAAQEVLIGSDTWVIFPSRSKGSGTDETQNQAVAYKKIP